MIKSFKLLTKFELTLWIVSVIIVSLSFLFAPSKDFLSLVASLIGVTALIFVAKGHVLGQILTVMFALFYGVISFFFAYYGEMITYLFMTSPMAVMAALQWHKNPYKKSKEVKVGTVTKNQLITMVVVTVIVTFVFYFILKALNTANLLFSTISIATSFLAAYLTYLRSPYYAVAYCANDVVLIILWVLASVKDSSYIPMIFCFVMFLLNDIYGYINWQKMMSKQTVK